MFGWMRSPWDLIMRTETYGCESIARTPDFGLSGGISRYASGDEIGTARNLSAQERERKNRRKDGRERERKRTGKKSRRVGGSTLSFDMALQRRPKDEEAESRGNNIEREMEHKRAGGAKARKILLGALLSPPSALHSALVALYTVVPSARLPRTLLCPVRITYGFQNGHTSTRSGIHHCYGEIRSPRKLIIRNRNATPPGSSKRPDHRAIRPNNSFICPTYI